MSGIKLNMSTTYHPQTDGQIEAVNKCLEGYLRNFTANKQHQWHKWLHLAKQCYSTTYPSATKMTTFQALYGFEPPSLLKWTRTSKVHTVQEQQQQMQHILEILKDNLNLARNRMKQQVDLRKTERTFMPRDQVFLRLQPHKQINLKQSSRYKLQPKFFGPYKILAKIGEIAYQLELAPTNGIHNTFHVSCLKQKLGKGVLPQLDLSILDDEGKIVVESKGILQVRTKRLCSREIKEYLIKWKARDNNNATW